MVEVEVYILGVSLLLRSTSTSICFCIQTSRATFTSLHTLHIHPKPKSNTIIDQSPPPSPPSPPQKFDTAPTSPITTKSKMAVPLGAIFTRISITCAEPGCDTYTTGHEVMMIDPAWCYAVLCDKIKKWVESLQAGDSKVRSNIRQCVWSDDHKIINLKVNWNGLAGNGWSDNGETNITTKNYDTVLAMMAKRNSLDNLAVTISAN